VRKCEGEKVGGIFVMGAEAARKAEGTSEEKFAK
jgi:hypothetical protein